MADRVETNIVLIGSRQWYRAADGKQPGAH
jgi:hypothetical protein